MKFYDRDFNHTPGYIRWLGFLERHHQYKDVHSNTNVLLIFLRDYLDMCSNDTIDAYIDKAKENNINFIMLEDPHNYPIVPEYVYTSPIKTFLLHNDFTINNKLEPHRLYHPNWLFFVQDKNDKVDSIDPVYPLSSANRNICYRPGKIYNYVKLKDQAYFDKILFTKYRTETKLDCHWPRPEDAEFERIFQMLNSEYDSWPELDNDLFAGMAAVNLPVYTKSLFHLVAESGVRENLISEKTYKIFHSQQIPIFCGAKNLVNHLRTLGFDMFDDIVHHAQYDNVDDFKRRIDAMHTVVEKIIGLDHNKILLDTVERRQKNYDWLHSDQLSYSIVEPIIKRLQYEL